MANSARPTQWGVGSGRSSGIPSLPRVGWRGCFQPACAFAWSGLEILLFLSALCGVGWDFVPRRPPGLAGFSIAPSLPVSWCWGVGSVAGRFLVAPVR